VVVFNPIPFKGMKLFTLNDSSQKPRGVIVGGLWAVSKVNGFSMKFKAKERVNGELVDKTGQKLLEVNYGDSFLCLPNSRKRADKKDPDFTVLYTPKQDK